MGNSLAPYVARGGWGSDGCARSVRVAAIVLDCPKSNAQLTLPVIEDHPEKVGRGGVHVGDLLPQFPLAEPLSCSSLAPLRLAPSPGASGGHMWWVSAEGEGEGAVGMCVAHVVFTWLMTERRGWFGLASSPGAAR